MGKVIWTEKATVHLKAIHDYISEDSSVYAVRFVKALINATLKLEKFPYAGRMVPEFEHAPLNIREVIYQGIVSFISLHPISMLRLLRLHTAVRICLIT